MRSEVLNDRWRRFLAAAGVAVYLGGFGYVCILLWRWGLIAGLRPVSVISARAQLAGQAAILLGAVTVTVGYLVATDRQRSYLRLRAPTLEDLGWILGGVVVLFGFNVVVEMLGLPLAEHSIREIARSDPTILLGLIVGSVLFVGPGEELLYRGIVQQAAGERAGTVAGILLASVVFAAVHVFALVSAPFPALLGTLGVVFVLSIGLGVMFARTESLVVVAVTHGLYDALAFGTMYWEYALS